MPDATVATACTVDPVAFDTNDDDQDLRRLCYSCPLYFPCRTFAIATLTEGFAGGLSRLQRRRLRKQAAA